MGKDLSFCPSKYMAILNHVGTKSSSLPLKFKAILPTWGRSHAFFLQIHPSPASPQSAMLPFPTYPPPSTCICRKDSSPFRMQYPGQILPHNFSFIYLFLFLFYLSIFIHLFYSFFCFSYFYHYFLFPQKTWNSSPKWKSYSPAFGANNRRIDAPGWVLRRALHHLKTNTK